MVFFGHRERAMTIPFRAAILALGVSLLASCDLPPGTAPPPERIILIVVDTLRRDHVSAYSETVSTPNIDRLAEGGQLFDNALSSFHSTTMSMASMMTGRTPSIESGDRSRAFGWNTFASCGMSRFVTPEEDARCVPDSMTTLAEDLRDAGYSTMGVVANSLLFRPNGYDQGFDGWVEVGRGTSHTDNPLLGSNAVHLRTAVHVNKAAIELLETRESDRFFLYVHYIDVHDWQLRGVSYAKGVGNFDVEFGKLLDYLEAEDLLEDATVIFTSDHGEMLSDSHLGFKTRTHFGNPSWEPVLRVPLIVRPPTDEDGSVLVRSQDIRGLVSRMLRRESDPETVLDPDELITTEQLFQTYHKGAWKSIWSRANDRFLLFDLEHDPDEMKDLADSRPDLVEKHRARVEELSTLLAAPNARRQELSDEELDRLRSLGYLDEPEEASPVEP